MFQHNIGDTNNAFVVSLDITVMIYISEEIVKMLHKKTVKSNNFVLIQ